MCTRNIYQKRYAESCLDFYDGSWNDEPGKVQNSTHLPLKIAFNIAYEQKKKEL